MGSSGRWPAMPSTTPSRELTTSVLWLNDRGLDIRCVRLKPYKMGDRVFLDVRQVIPLPEAEAYQVSVREKARRERTSRRRARAWRQSAPGCRLRRSAFPWRAIYVVRIWWKR